MTAMLVERDPLAPNLLPSRPDLVVSADAPSGGTVRPFGLTRVATLGANEDVVTLDGTSYNPALQVNVDTNGQPFVDTPNVIHMGTSTDTKHDNQWFKDKD